MKEVKKMSKKKKTKKNIFVRILRCIYKVLDKLLVTPLSKIYYRIDKFLKKNAYKLDGILNKQEYLIAFSLIIAIGTFLLIDSRAINLVETESEILSDEKVKVIYNKEKYVVEGIPESVDIILMGRKSDLYLAKQLGDHELVLDLSNYKTGEYSVKLKYNHSVESVKYKLDPGTVNVTISEKVSAVKTLTYDLLNQDKLNSKLNVSDVTLTESEVFVKGSSQALKDVAVVKVLIDLAQLELESSGTFDIDKLPMVAYDEKGNPVENVEIVPYTASAKLKVESYFVDLPIKVVPDGKFATGYAISSAVSSVTSVRVYGDQSALSKLSYIPAVIDVEGLSEDKTFNVTLAKPSGVRYMSQTTTTVKIKLAEEITKEFEEVSIIAENLGSQYVANTVNLNDMYCTVIVKGAANVVENIKTSSIKAYVDLSGYGPGTHKVAIKVTGQDLTVTYEPKVQSIDIKILNK